ncbi:MAG: 2-amino-4-hydroxy-6-hydroxymethyldihydropteridine diphosphokinase [Pyrinomonadaceae bacterium]
MAAHITYPKGYIGLGSNLGDRAGNLLLAVRQLFAVGIPVTRLSSVYETAPVGMTEQAAFLNMVAEVNTTSVASPEQVLGRLQRIENQLGRTRSVRMGPRTIDLDLLLYDGEQRDTEFITLPHPRLHLRRFVLTPLAELSPELVHPILNKSISELLDLVADGASVRQWTP